MEYDVVIVGAGPAGLSAAIKLRQLSPGERTGDQRSACSKRARRSAPTSSRARSSSRARMNELIPDWQDKGAPLNSAGLRREVHGADREKRLRGAGLQLLAAADAQPRQLHRSRSATSAAGWPSRPRRWAPRSIRALPRPRCSTTSRAGSRAWPPATWASPRPASRRTATCPAWSCWGKYTFFAEGCRGSLTKTLFERFKLREGCDPQTFGIGIKELWELDPAKHKQGLVMHTAGWPMDSRTWGGSFIYHLEGGQAAVGYVVGLDYENPHLFALRGDAALQDPSQDPAHAGGRQAGRLRRPGAQRGRPAVDSQAGVPRRRLDRLHGGLPQRAQDQGQPQRHEDRHAGRRGRLRGAFKGGDEGYGTLDAYPKPSSRAPGSTRSCTRRATSGRPSPSGASSAPCSYGGLDLKVLGGKAPWTLHNKHPTTRA